MKSKSINTSQLMEEIPNLNAGDRILLSGEIYTARDAAHKRIMGLLENSEPVPFDLKNAIIYYAGPTPAPPGLPIGSCGPTTSGRMDIFTPRLLELGVKGMIGKGNRSKEVCEAIVRHGAIYLCAVGGAGALAAKCVEDMRVVAFPELGCESVKCLRVKSFPLLVGIDSRGESMFK